MTKRHLKRLTSPKTWPIKRKENKWITRTRPGPHSLKKSIPLKIALREMMGYARTGREAKIILNQGKILVNHMKRNDQKFPVGIMDTIEIPEIKEQYRMIYNDQGKFKFVKINKEEASLKPVRITNKTTLKGKKTQLNFNDGTNMIVDKDSYKVNDTLIIDMNKEEKNKISKHLKFEKGARIYLTDGKHMGNTGIIEEIHTTFQNKSITIKTEKGTYKTQQGYALVIDQSITTGEK